MQVCGREFSNRTIERISAALQAEQEISRRELSRRVCRWLEWRSPNGKLKDMSCRVALGKLHRRGLIELPETTQQGLFVSKTTDWALPEIRAGITDLKGSLGALGHVEIIPVEPGDRDASRMWNAMMDRYHYLGKGHLCGAQKRYFITSSQYGYIGGLAFSAAAWRLAPRDQWIGWTDHARLKNLSKVLCNSRFLLIPRIKNLASHTLRLCLERIKDDWSDQYGVSPVLVETYVEKDSYRGTCYRASNWLHIGATQGRGRNDRSRDTHVPVKDVYVLPLERHARRVLRHTADEARAVPTAGNIPKKSAHAGNTSWAKDEFGGACLGDHRLTKRLVTLAEDMYARPQSNIPQACQSRAKTKAAYRFLGHREVTMDKILEPHYQQTVERIAHYPVVLAAQDSSSLNYSAHPALKDIGPIGGSSGGPFGLILHDTMAFSLEGTPLGLLDVQCWARDRKSFGKRKDRANKPIEQKESYKWLKSFERVAWAQKQCPDTVLVSVGDREADLYDLFEAAVKDPKGPKVLVRAMQNRVLADEQGHLWSHISSLQIASYLTVRVPRQGRKAPREAVLEIRFDKVKLRPPELKRNKPALTVWGILARETQASAQGDPIHWKLITTCEVETAEQAVEKVGWYSRRWGIEVYHRTLKSGCKVEERQLGSADRIETCLAIDMVVAWRIFHLTMLGRETPDVPCSVFFEEHEWRALQAYWTGKPTAQQEPTLREAIRMTARLGGFLDRKSDGEPGTKSLWLGIQRVDDLATMYKVMSQAYVPQSQNSPVSSDPGYG